MVEIYQYMIISTFHWTGIPFKKNMKYEVWSVTVSVKKHKITNNYLSQKVKIGFFFKYGPIFFVKIVVII